MLNPPATPQMPIKAQFNENNEEPESNKFDFRIVMRMPNARPPVIPNRVVPVILPYSKTPNKKPHAKKPRTTQLLIRSLTPKGMELMSTAQAVYVE